MTLKLIQTKEYLLLINEKAEIKKGDYILEKELIINIFPDYLTDLDECSKIIAYYPLTDEATELDLPLLPNPFEEEIDIEKLSNKLYPVSPQKRRIWIEGYKAAQSSNKQYSLEDVEKAFDYYAFTSIDNQPYNRLELEREFNQFIQSLSTQQLPVSFEPEYEDYEVLGERDEDGYPLWKKRLKTITNSEGKEELVGIYK